MSAFYSLSDDEDGQEPIAGPSSLTATPRRKQQADSSSMMLESPSASPFSRGAGAGAANAITPPPRHHGAYNARSSSPSAGRRREGAGSTALPNVAASASAGAAGAGPPPPLPAIERLQKVWVAERCAPDLMAWSDPGARYRCDDVVDEVCAQIEQQVGILNLLSADESTSEEEHLRLSLVQLDVERARWLLRAFLRTRLSKIEEHAQHYLALSDDETSQAQAGTALLSPLEKAYATKYTTLRTSHFSHAVLDYLPESLRSLTDSADDDSTNSAANMVSRPDAAGPVFVRCVEDCGSLRMEDGETAQLVKGSVHLLRWERVRGLVRVGRAELV